jgi:hypothetical protein
MALGRKKQSEAEDVLTDAFATIEKTSERLDSLKRSYNEIAREVCSVTTAVVPVAPAPPPNQLPLPRIDTPAIAFRPPLSVPRPSGRYSMTATIVPEKPAPKRSRSGRFYLQVGKVENTEELAKLRDEVSKCGRVVDSGTGTASNPDAGWMEVAVRDEDTGVFNLKLAELEGLSNTDRVEKVIPVEPGEGRIQAKQLDLFPKAGDEKPKI